MTSKQDRSQVKDDFELLSLMMNDTAAADPLYQPTPYWKDYERQFLPELKRLGLRDFRRRHNSILACFGATDLVPCVDLRCSRLVYNRWVRKLPGWAALIRGANALARQCESCGLLASNGITLGDILESTYGMTAAIGNASRAEPLEKLDVSLAGNPEAVFVKQGRHYTPAAFYYYLRYAYCCRHTSFADGLLIAELGSGSGKQIEVIKKLHPDTRFFLFDIPPQLYVCEQYLKAVFPGQVVSYRETREWSQLALPKQGQICILPNWKFPKLASSGCGLFWNAASFQEMEPDVVANYLTHVRIASKAVYLQEKMHGKEVALKPGMHGVREQTTLRHYEAGLEDFQRVDLSPCLTPVLNQPSLYGYYDSFWQKLAL
jgi:putative sugar O-methyltransferase